MIDEARIQCTVWSLGFNISHTESISNTYAHTHMQHARAWRDRALSLCIEPVCSESSVKTSADNCPSREKVDVCVRACVSVSLCVLVLLLSMQVESCVLVSVCAVLLQTFRCQVKFIFYLKDGDIFSGLKESPITNINVPIYRSP